MKLRTAWIAATLGLVACAAMAEGTQKKGPASSGATVFAQDKGKLAIKLDGQIVGHEEFEIAPSSGGWTAKGTTSINPPGGTASKITGTLTLQPDGAPLAYDWTAQAEKTNGAHVLFSNGVAKITLEMQGAHPYDQTFSFGTPLVAILDDNLYHQYAILARIYDWSKGGVQTLPVLIPQELTPGSITVESTGSAPADGKTYLGLKVATSDLEIHLLLDGNHRLMRLEVPTAKVSVIRE